MNSTQPLPDAPVLFLSQWEVVEQLSSSRNSTVYRAISPQHDQRIIVKRLEGAPHRAERLARYHQEYMLSHELNSPGVVHALSLIQDVNGLAICFRDSGGYSLRHWMALRPLHLLEHFLPLSLRICDGLADLHRHFIIHRDINPSNIVWNPPADRVELIDLGLASQLGHETPQLQPPSQLEGTLPYCSPEQTGRMNRRLDYRTDFYSLGVTFFELLTGRRPYEHTDPLALIHAHIAASTPSIIAIRPDLPPIIEAIVDKLMAKRAEDRYQSVHGLRHDLRRCLIEWQDRRAIEPFTLGTQDFTPQPRLLERLYGRDTQLAQVMEAFEATREGRRQLLLVSGYSGIGKSSLVHELHKPITARRGLFASGKFEQFNRGIAYSALSQALRALVQQLLAEPESTLGRLRRELKDALGGSAGVAVELVQELGLLLGDVPPVEPLTGPEAQSRFNLVMRKLLECLARPERPVVLFLDDLQWADLASLYLLENLYSDASLQHLLLIGAYRDNEVDETHALTRTLRALERVNVSLVTLHLPPLTLPQVQELLRDSLGQPFEELEPLAGRIHRHTLGNPFFVGQFLREIHRRQFLVCDMRNGTWSWDLEAIDAAGFTDNVIDLLTGTLKLLPPHTQRLLELAACVGNLFPLELMRWVEKAELSTIVEALWPALEKGLVESPNGSSLLAMARVQEQTGEGSTLHCRFVHDRVQQSAYFRLSPDERAVLHWKIGTCMLEHFSPEQREEQLFALVAQLNLGRSQMQQPSERVALARLNLEAAHKAHRSTAYESAAQYVQLGRDIIADLPWHEDHRLHFELTLSAAECSYLLGRFEEADALYPILLAHAQNSEDTLDIGVIQADHYLLQARHLEGLAVARRCFAQVQLEVADTLPAIEAALQNEMVHIEALLQNRPVESLLDLPLMTDNVSKAMIRLTYGMFLNAFLSGQGSLAFLSLSLGVRLSLTHGNSPLSGYVYVGYGMVLYLLKKAYHLGYRFAHAGVQLAERFPELSTRCKTLFLFSADVHSWTQPIRNGQQYYDRAYQLALQSGDWVTLGYVVAQSASDRFTSGVPLGSLLPLLQEQQQLLKRVQNEDGGGLLQVASLLPIQRLMGIARTPTEQVEFSEELYLSRHADNPFYLAWHASGEVRVGYLLEERERYPELAQKVALVEQYIPSHAKVPECCFYGALFRLELRRIAASDAERREHERELNRLISRLEEFAAACPENVRHRLELVLAERARQDGNYGVAMEHLEAAIRMSRDQQYLQLEALALELYARLWLSLERPRMAMPLLLEARERYLTWGAHAVVERLDRQHPGLLAASNLAMPPSLPPVLAATTEDLSLLHSFHTPSYISGSHPSLQVEVDSMMRASKTLSTQIDFEEASRHLLQLLMMTAGAQRCVRIASDPNGSEAYLVELADEAGVRTLTGLPLDSPEASQYLGSSVARWALRSQRVVVLANAVTSLDFGQDPSVTSRQVHSVLCLPLQSQGQLQGLLYLENNLSDGVFTQERVEMLSPLCTQLSITLTNVRLFRDLEQHKLNLEHLVEARTRALNETLETLKATQQELIQSARLAGLGNTVAGVAHELNTPLGVALTAESLMTEELTFLYQASRAPHPNLREIRESVERLMEASLLTRQNVERAALLVKTFKQVAVDRSHSLVRLLHIKSYLEQVLLSLSPLIRRHHLQVQFTPDSEDPAYLCDAGILAQILTNLLENAGLHAYGGKGGKVEIQVRSERGGVDLQVQDFGAGMTESVAMAAFDPFFSTHRHRGSTGLGLHVVHNAVTQGLRGEIHLVTQPEHGTRMVIRLPAPEHDSADA